MSSSSGSTSSVKAQLSATQSFLVDSTVRWCYADGIGLKLNYSDFRNAWLKYRCNENATELIVSKKANDEEDDKLIKMLEPLSKEDFESDGKKKKNKKEFALTFEQCCKLICIWFPQHKDAVVQISWLKRLLRRQSLTEDKIFIHGQGKIPTKRICEDLSNKQMSKVAKNNSSLRPLSQRIKRMLLKMMIGLKKMMEKKSSKKMRSLRLR